MNKKPVFTRRDFLVGSSATAAGMALGIPNNLKLDSPVSPKTSRAVLVRDPDAMSADGKYNGPVLSRMLDDAVTALLETSSADEAWSQLLNKDDKLGIKTNIWRFLYTPKELEQAVRSRALNVGIPSDNIAIADRGIHSNPQFTEATALINMRPLRTHHWSGIGGCLKNYITFHSQPWTWHGDSCADLGGIWKLPVCAGKTRLNVLVVLRPLFYGIGPHHFDPEHSWFYNGLLVSQDPVALDSLGVKLLEEKRNVFFDKPPKGGTSAKHVQYAETRHGVGLADLSKIDLVKIGYTEDSLL